MGTQSSNNPMQKPVRGIGSTTDLIMRICQAIGLLIGVAVPGTAQTPATVLPLLLPSAIAFDIQGNLYIADTGDHVVRKLSVNGAITTVAGTGVQGFLGDNGPASAAELDSPAGLAIDPTDNLYIADSHNHRIREVIATTGIIKTIAGTGSAGFLGDGGLAKAASLNLPTALVVDSIGNLYFADTNNHRVRQIRSSTGIISTVAGNGTQGFTGDNGPATSANIDSPNGLAVDAAGNLSLADTHNGRVRQVSAATGLITTIAGGSSRLFAGDGGVATAAGLALPRGLTVDSAGNLYIADSANHRIRRISPSGTITTVAGEGTQTFAGDGAPAIAASLDTPRSVAVSPDGLMTLADTANKRVRQFDSIPPPATGIHTITGIGNVTPGALSIAVPSVVAYGSGTVTTTMSGSTAASGSITLLDTTNGTAVTLGSVVLAPTGLASFGLGAVAAGSHSLTAVYSGDATHGAAQSSTLAITITPLGVVATPNPVSILYGQQVPLLSGSLTGILPQDAGKVTADFTSTVAALSPPGSYLISALLTGPAAMNYTVTAVPVNLDIAKAPSIAVLSSSTISSTLSSPVTLQAQITSTTSGIPTGSIALMDGATLLTTVPLSATGGANFTTSSLSPGAHPLTAVYDGDANFLPSSSPATSLTVAAASDFTLTSTGTAFQTVVAGTSATFNFSIAIQGALPVSPINLTAQGLPPGATASFAPATIPPGGSVTTFTLTIQTPHAALDRPQQPSAPLRGLPSLLALVIPVFGMGRRISRRNRTMGRIILFAALPCALMSLATGCGNRVNTPRELGGAVTYTITVTGTATSPNGAALQHSSVVTLQVL